MKVNVRKKRLCRFQYRLGDSFKNLTSVYVSSVAFPLSHSVFATRICFNGKVLFATFACTQISCVISHLIVGYQSLRQKKVISRKLFFSIFIISFTLTANHYFIDWIRLHKLTRLLLSNISCQLKYQINECIQANN